MTLDMYPTYNSFCLGLGSSTGGISFHRTTGVEWALIGLSYPNGEISALIKPRRQFGEWLLPVVFLVCFPSAATADEHEDEIQNMITRGQFTSAQKRLELLGDAGHSKSARANFLYAQCLIFSGKFDEAEPILKRCAMSEDSDYSRIPYHASNMLSDLPLMKRKREEFDEMNRQGYTGLVLKEGNIVELVVKGSSADDAGIKPGDKILEINGSQIPNSYEQTLKKIRGQIGTSVSLLFERNGKRLTCNLTRANSLYDVSKDTSKVEGWVETSKSTDKQKRSD